MWPISVRLRRPGCPTDVRRITHGSMAAEDFFGAGHEGLLVAPGVKVISRGQRFPRSPLQEAMIILWDYLGLWDFNGIMGWLWDDWWNIHGIEWNFNGIYWYLLWLWNIPCHHGKLENPQPMEVSSDNQGPQWEIFQPCLMTIDAMNSWYLWDDTHFKYLLRCFFYKKS